MSSPYINAPVRARMYATKQHKVIWIVAVAASAGRRTAGDVISCLGPHTQQHNCRSVAPS